MHCNLFVLFGKIKVFSDFACEILSRLSNLVGFGTCTDRNLAADDDVFLETVQVISATAGCSVDEHTSRILEGSGR